MVLNQQYLRPKTLSEAVELLSKYGKEAKVLAGGTDLIINLRDNIISCKYLIDIKAIPEMNELSYSEEEGLKVGGAVSLNDMIEFKDVQEKYPILVQGAKTLANSLLRNRATMLGNLCNASPGADMAPPALVLEGAVEAVSKEGRRIIPLKEFFLGVKKNALKEDELAVRVVFPPACGKGHYLKKQRIKGHDLSQVGVAGYLKNDGKYLFALGAVGPTPVLIDGLCSEDSADTIVKKVLGSISPISDQRASKEYRVAMAEYLTRKVIELLAKEV
jgi:CO/xanthine dehydrogenase FAD-binding subunit